MKHAGPIALDGIEPLLALLRTRAALKEKKRGIFYRRGRSFLHFHEDPAGTFADLAVANGDVRMRVSTAREQQALLQALDAMLEDGPAAATVPPR